MCPSFHSVESRAKVGHSDSQHQFALAYGIRLREALELGGDFDSLSDWYCQHSASSF